MFIRLLIALIILIGVMAFLGWYGKASAQKRNDALKGIVLYGIGAALLLLVVTGRIPWLFAIITAIIPFWRKIMAARNMLGLFQKATGQKITATTFTTEWLVMQFDIVSRTIDGKIIKGTSIGQRLSQLSDMQIRSLLQECNKDRQSVIAINAFIRGRSAGWEGDDTQHDQRSDQRNDKNYDKGVSGKSTMSRSQAFEILGLEKEASMNDISHAHKRLMQKLHPDRGGSSYLATQINLAKDTLTNS